MILLDAGPLVALFDPKDGAHDRCRRVLRKIDQPLGTTLPVLTEAFHILSPASQGSRRLRDFVAGSGLSLLAMDHADLVRAFELMEHYRDHPMDLTDASLIVAAERLETLSIFTIDRDEFATYRIRRGHRHEPVVIVG